MPLRGPWLRNISVVAPLLALVAPPEIRCDYSKRFVCSWEGCKVVSSGEAYLLLPNTALTSSDDPELMDVRLCNSSGCEMLPVQREVKGDLLRIGSAAKGYLLVIARSAVDSFTVTSSWGAGFPPAHIPSMAVGDFLEINTLAVSTVVGFGRCPGVIPRSLQ